MNKAMSAGITNQEVLTHIPLTPVDNEPIFQDKLVFWGTLYLTPVVWLIFCVMNILTFAIFKTATTSVCMIIAVVQFWGYKNCRDAHNRKMKIQNRKKGKGLFAKAYQDKKNAKAAKNAAKKGGKGMQ